MTSETMLKIKQIDSYTLRDLAYTRIKEFLLQGVLKSGDKIFQEKMAEELGISKSPLLQALALLEKEEILYKIPQKGFFVKKVSENEILKFFEIRFLFEEIGIKRLTENLSGENIKKLNGYLSNFKKYFETHNRDNYVLEDVSFHHFFIESTNNEMMVKFVDRFNVFILTFIKGTLDLEESYRDHLNIINAILENDCEKSLINLKEHHNKVKIKVLQK